MTYAYDPTHEYDRAEDAAVYEERSRALANEGETLVRMFNFVHHLCQFKTEAPMLERDIAEMLKARGWQYVTGGRWVDPDTAKFCDTYNAWEERYNEK